MRQPAPRFCLHPLALTGLVLAASLGGCGTGDDATASSSTSYTINYVLTSPAELSFQQGLVTVSGTLSVSAKVPASSLRTVLRVKGMTWCDHWAANQRFQAWKTTPPTNEADKQLFAAMTAAEAPCAQKDATTGNRGVATNKAFSFTFDSAAVDSKNKPMSKDGKLCVSLASEGKDATGEYTVCVEVDNAPPEIEIFEPKPNSVHIGVVKVSGVIREKNLQQAAVVFANTQVGASCDKKAAPEAETSCETCAKKFQVCLATQGPFSFVVDRSDEPTENVELRVVVLDRTAHKTEASVALKKLKRPRFEAARLDFDGTFSDDLFAPSVETGDLVDFQLIDVDHDGLLDALFAGTKGLFVRHGLPSTGPNEKGAKGRGVFGKTQLIHTGEFKRLASVDIDGDGQLDVVAAAMTDATSAAALAFLTRKGALPRFVAQEKLGAPPTAMASADFNMDKRNDVIIGSKIDAHALTVLYLNPKPICPTKGDESRPCANATDAATIGSANVFVEKLERSLLGGVASFAVADFIADDNDPPLPDIAVGREGMAVLSVCRNNGKGFDACVDITKVDFLADMQDSAFLVPGQFNDDDGDGDIDEADHADLVVVSKAGKARWVTGDHAGGFKYDIAQKGHYTIVWSTDAGQASVESVEVAPIGPNGEDWLLFSMNARSTTALPLDPSDTTAKERCYRYFVLGSAISMTHVGDIDADGELDLVGLGSKMGLNTALGKGDGEFAAVSVYRVCGLFTGGTTLMAGPLSTDQFKVVDVTGDTKADLIMVSEPAVSSVPCPATSGAGPQPRPAYYFGLYVNGDDGLSKLASRGEFGPYNSATLRKLAGEKDLVEGGCGIKFGKVTAMEFGEFNGSPPIDMVTTHELDYPSGGDVPEGGDKLLSCGFDETLELANIWGDESADNKDAKGLQCKVFGEEDDKKTTPLVGFGGGAHIKRASMHIWINNGDPNAPFNIQVQPSAKPQEPLKPFFAQAGGSSPVAAAVGKFDEDEIDDVATLMLSSGTYEDPQYMAERVRLFKGDGKGRVRPVVYVDVKKPGRKDEIGKFCTYNKTLCELIDVPHDQLSAQPFLPKGAFELEFTFPTYRTVAASPVGLQAAPFCDDEISSLFTLSSEAGDITVLRQQGKMVFERKKAFSVGENPTAFRASDVNQDGCVDLLIAKKAHLGYTAGTPSWYAQNKYFSVQSRERTSVATLDVNDDKILDLVVVDSDQDAVQFYLGDGKGEFVEHSERLFAAHKSTDMQQADLNGDGCPDLAVKGLFGVAVMLNLGCAPQ